MGWRSGRGQEIQGKTWESWEACRESKCCRDATVGPSCAAGVPFWFPPTHSVESRHKIEKTRFSGIRGPWHGAKSPIGLFLAGLRSPEADDSNGNHSLSRLRPGSISVSAARLSDPGNRPG
jgi:hypothetical protein